MTAWAVTAGRGQKAPSPLCSEMPLSTSTGIPLAHQTFDDVEAVELGVPFGHQGQIRAPWRWGTPTTLAGIEDRSPGKDASHGTSGGKMADPLRRNDGLYGSHAAPSSRPRRYGKTLIVAPKSSKPVTVTERSR